MVQIRVPNEPAPTSWDPSQVTYCDPEFVPLSGAIPDPGNYAYKHSN